MLAKEIISISIYKKNKLAAYSLVYLIPLLKCIQLSLNTCQYIGMFG